MKTSKGLCYTKSKVFCETDIYTVKCKNDYDNERDVITVKLLENNKEFTLSNNYGDHHVLIELDGGESFKLTHEEINALGVLTNIFNKYVYKTTVDVVLEDSEIYED